MERVNKDRQLKVLLVNGSPHRNGNTFTALSEVAKALDEEGIASEIVHIGNRWKSHATLTLLAKQDCPLWLQYD